MEIDGSDPFSYSHTPAVTSTGSCTKPDFQAIQSATESDVAEFSSVSDAGALLSGQTNADVRQQRVEALRDVIQSGRYGVSDRQLANARQHTRLFSQVATLQSDLPKDESESHRTGRTAQFKIDLANAALNLNAEGHI